MKSRGIWNAIKCVGFQLIVIYAISQSDDHQFENRFPMQAFVVANVKLLIAKIPYMHQQRLGYPTHILCLICMLLKIFSM